jgi:phosphatidylserine/phosphatidylglycerophosphate/cardiolipin synthase-like enzyme
VVRGLVDLLAADREGRSVPDTVPLRLIVGPERARRQMTALIEQAKSSIRLIDAKLTDPALVALLNARRAAGVTVEIYGAKRYADLTSHGKLMMIDGEKAVIGSLALAALSLDFRREVAVVVEDAAAVAEVAELVRFVATAAAREASVAASAAGGPAC